ncbi:MAG TPA: ABC transporter substrate-binding protein, partial [Gaiellaceae bacterium]|nr:ABC transporter substrate-binding protein [Gaiellaceae bacterium]
MKHRSARTRAGLVLGVALVAAAVLAAVLAQGAGAKPGPAAIAAPAASHTCLVMTGSGDPAFVRNFNPYTATSLPSGDFVKGAFYEPLVIATAAGGGHLYPWLATSWKWSNGAKTLTLWIKQGVKWSDGKPLTAADVVYSLTAGKQNKVADLIGLYREGTNIAS